jgi:hypothetical protein
MHQTLTFQMPPTINVETMSTAGPTTGETTSSQILGKNAPLYKKLTTVLTAQRTGWTIDFDTYAPGPYRISWLGVTLNCWPNALVASVTHGTTEWQYSKQIPNLFQLLGLSPPGETK